MVLAGSLLAQSQSASLSGEITDSSGAAVPHAALRAVNMDTGEAFRAASNDSGNYDFPLLKPGRYTVTAELTGFKQVQETGIVLETGVPTRVNLRLEVGSMADKVTVEAAAPLVQSETAAVGAVVQNSTIVDMPLIDHLTSQLTKLNGFVVQATTGSNPQFAMAGGRGVNANWRIDGGNNNNVLLGVSGVAFDPPAESVQEFNVSLSNYSAELGRTGGGLVMATTKSGSNALHGSAYEYLRNTALNTRTFFSSSVPILHYNLFGTSIGGPIKKNRTFFFFNYEGLRPISQTPQILNVPTPAEARGDFSPDTYVVRDPTTSGRAPFPGNIIPLSEQDPVGAKIAAFYPAPNLPGRPSGSSNFSAPLTQSVPGNTYVARVDHTIRDNDRIFGRILRSGAPTITGTVYAIPGADSLDNVITNGYFNVSVTYTHSFSGTALNEARYSYDRRKYRYDSSGEGSGLNGKLGFRAWIRISSACTTSAACRDSVIRTRSGSSFQSSTTISLTISPSFGATTK
jgi:hypothetical protein